MAFADYIKIVGDYLQPPDGDSSRRSEWSHDQIASGVVTQAMNCLAKLLDPDFAPTVYLLSDNVWSLSRSIVYLDCRVHILGTNERSSIPRRLIAEAIDKAREAITLCVLPSVGLEFVNLRDPVSLDIHTGVIPLYPNDIDALATDKVTIGQLIEYKLFRRILAQRPDAQTPFIERIFREYGCDVNSGAELLSDLDRAIETRGETEVEWLEHPYLAQLDNQIARRRHTLLFGYSSSGKTILSFQVGRRRALAGWQVRYVNLSDEISWPAGLIQDLLFSTAKEESEWDVVWLNQLIIVDDLQSRPALARLFLALGSLIHRVRNRVRPVLLGVSWKEFAAVAAESCPEVAAIAVHAQLVRDRLLEKYSATIDNSTIAAIAAEAGDDLYLLRLALEVTARQATPASREAVAQDVWQDRIPTSQLMPEAARRVALLTGAIGQFDIHVSPEFIQRAAQVESRILSQLIESRLLRRIGDRLTLGHRSLCALIAWWLGKNGAWNELASVGGPHDVASAVLAYLKVLGTTSMTDALRALVARAGFKQREALSQRAVAVMDAWRAFDAVVERVERQQAADPTWGNTPSSSMFVTILLTEIGKAKLATPSLEFLRSHWSVSEERLQIDVSGLSTVVDFDIIRQRMLEEDRDSLPFIGVETAVEVNIERFHKSWLSGLILGAEAAAETPRMPLEHLASLVEQEQIRTSGAFYPHRVPWCTARVLLGLAACGRSINTSHTVSRAVDWLLRDRQDGGASSGGIWRAGTGSWNNPIETTALVLLAVIRAGLDPSDLRLTEARRYLLSQREQWEGLDGGVAIEALLASGTKWEDLASDTARLSQRMLDQSLWLRATLPANEIFQQTCHVAQAATHLIEIGWGGIRSDLKDLLDALDLPAESTPPTNLAKSLTIETETNAGASVSDRHATVDDVANRVSAIHDLALSRFCVVGDYSRFDERARNDLRHRYHTIRKGLDHKTTARENHLIWAPPGSGKTYFVTEIAHAMGEAFLQDNFHLLNLSALSKEAFVAKLDSLAMAQQKPILCVIDEIDSRSSEAWPYESLFSCLDWNTSEDRHIVFVIVGSGGRGLNGMIGAIKDRPRGADLIDRVFETNRFEIPSPTDEDRLIVFAKQVLIAAKAKHQDISEVDRLALYYVLRNDALSTPRQLAELAKASVGRMDASDGRLLYDHLFRIGDRQRMDFWAKNAESAELLQGTFITLGD